MKPLFNFFENIFVSIFAYLLWLAMVIINKSCHIKFLDHNYQAVNLDELIKKIKEKHRIIFAVWHQANFPLFYSYRKHDSYILSTLTRRGEILSRATKRFGFQMIQLPTEENSFDSARLLIKVIRNLRKGGNCVIAADGPWGPLHEVKPGTIIIAQQSGNAIFPAGVGFSKKISLKKRWDKYFIPLPFSKIIIIIGAPFVLGKKDNAEEKAKELREVMLSLTKKAEEIARS